MLNACYPFRLHDSLALLKRFWVPRLWYQVGCTMFCFHAENWAQTFEITTLFFIVKQWYTPVTCLFWQPLHHLVNYIIIQLNNYKLNFFCSWSWVLIFWVKPFKFLLDLHFEKHFTFDFWLFPLSLINKCSIGWVWRWKRN